MLDYKRNLPAFSILLLCFYCCSQLSECLIVPEQFPSILSVIYSNIPPIKKGTDSRLGFGYRFGQHADFQVVLELGPQKETRPIGPQEDSNNSFNKRQVNKKDQKVVQKEQTSTERTAASWLENWSKDASASAKKKTKPNQSLTAKKSNEKGQSHNLPTMPFMSEQSMKQLQLLYKMATTTSTTTALPNTIFKGIGPLNLGPPAGFQAPPRQQLEQIQPRKTRGQITAELMDVSLEESA